MPNILLFSKKVVPLHYQNTSRSGAVVARRAHNPKVVGSSPASATKLRGCVKMKFLAQPLLDV